MEFVSSPRTRSPPRTYRSDYSANPPSWKPSTSRFQPRYSPVAAYDRLIHNSQFNQPLPERFPSHHHPEASVRHLQQRMYDSIPAHFSRSNEDLLNSAMDTSRPKPTRDSDFLQPSKYASHLRRSFDALNDFPLNRPKATFEPQQPQPTYRSTFTTHTNDYAVPNNQRSQPTCEFSCVEKVKQVEDSVH